ncbi:Bax inhibitor 1 [Cyanidiococcus yangmingshanensis]|uniref:Bax inhibitor 1 n=1 Tax=Cyanidiococcus yangmingshanensis TaxID=2690220 RepID=A0A7J7IQH0_9RHOD|nr:Bax inhibitor 1 [Cyanidiococcus yangmingshanensis]
MDPFGSDRFFRPETFKNFRELTPAVRQHLALVYRTLFYAVVWAVLGCMLQLRYGSLLPVPTGLLATIGNVRHADDVQLERLLMLFAALQGFEAAPLIQVALDVDEWLLLQALMATAAVFGAFSLAALHAKRRSYLYLAGWLGSALSVLGLTGGLGDWGLALLIYGGLLVFAGFVILDTQVIVERASNGDRDHVRHSLDLWMDLFAIFVRVIIVMLRSQESRERRRRERRK